VLITFVYQFLYTPAIWSTERKGGRVNDSAGGVFVGPSGGRRAKVGPWNFKLVGEESDGRMSAIETYFQPGVLLAPPHLHRREDQTIMVISGEITMEVGRQTFTAGAGSVIYVPRDTYHTAWGSGSEVAVVLEVNAPAGFEGYIQELDELIGSGKLDVQSMVDRGLVYGVEYDLPHTQELVQGHGLTIPGMSAAPAAH
jgi:mannose-6-phosphate isomerase-like protein (cupin superfamily)